MGRPFAHGGWVLADDVTFHGHGGGTAPAWR
jgi:hypothetical protein